MKTLSLISFSALLLASCSGAQQGNYPDGLPEDLRHLPDTDADMPEYCMEADSAKITINFLGEKPAEGELVNIVLSSIASYNELSPIPSDGSGRLTLNVPLEGATQVIVGLDDMSRRPGEAFVAPGEDTDIYLDLRPDSLRSEEMPKVYTNGRYADYNGALSIYGYPHAISVFRPMAPYYRLSGKEFADVMIKAYNDSVEAVKNDPALPKLMKQAAVNSMKADVLEHISMLELALRCAYMQYSGDPTSINPPADSVKLVLDAENVGRIANALGVDDMKLALAYSAPINMVLDRTDWSQYNVGGTALGNMSAYQRAAARALAGNLSEENIESVKNLGNPFYLNAVNSLDAQYKQKVEDAKKSLSVLPEGTDPEKIIETIVEPYKGKVVMIDMWNTWCSPCRAAIAENEPNKSGELSDPDIVWIYLADESSPMNLYVSLIPSIKGIHYRLTQDQAEALHKRFKLDGIPYYILVDRQGNIEGRPDLRDHELFKKTILEKLKK